MLLLQMSRQWVSEEPLKSFISPLARTQKHLACILGYIVPLFSAMITVLRLRKRDLQARSREVPRLVWLTIASDPGKAEKLTQARDRQTLSRSGSMSDGPVLEIE